MTTERVINHNNQWPPCQRVKESLILDDFIMTSKGGNDYIALTAFKLGVGDEVWTKRGLTLKKYFHLLTDMKY